jgi:two-component system NtrC family sensor kinase
MPYSRLLERVNALSGTSGDAVRSLRLLIAASLVLPILIFGIAAFLSYRNIHADTRDRMERTLGMVHEHAVKVFETFQISERFLEEVFRNVSDEQIRANEADYSRQLKAVADLVPQILDLWVIDANGHPLVAGWSSQLPRTLNLADRDYFAAHRGSDPIDTFISAPTDSRMDRVRFFAITRKRLNPDGSFNGVFLVSIAPDYFVQFYSRLPRFQSTAAALLRGDGTILARYPITGPSLSKIPDSNPLVMAMKAHPEGGFAEIVSPVDGVNRLAAFRKLPNFDAYVVTGIDTAQVTTEWLRALSQHLVFGIPATLTMFGLALMVLRRTQREAETHAQLIHEVTLRQTAEPALRQAQKMEAVGRLTGGIAHDFNNLLTAIGGNVDLAIRRLPANNERVQRSLESARQASQRAATLVQRLLTFSRQHPQEVKAVDINRLVQGMSDLLHRTLGERVVIETVLAGGLWKTAIDPNQLENALINLAVNARDAMPEGGKLTIETSNAYLDEAYASRTGGDIKAGQFVMVAVSDTGTGMKSDIRDKVFEPFFTTKPVGAGSGLGLSMVYGFVKQSAGHVQIYSELNEGTSLKLYFPRLPEGAAVPAWETADERPVASQPGKNERILLVEDEQAVREFVANALQELGYRAETASDAHIGLERLKSSTFDLLLTDVVLPGGMNGRQLADKAREMYPGLRVLFVTGYTRNAIIHQGRLDPDVNLLVKPFTADALARKLRQILDADQG